MAEIIVAGAGHGGLIAAARLAKAGHHVSVYEKILRDEYPLEQKDYFDANAMRFAGIEIPEHYYAENNRISFIPLDSDVPVLTMPENTENETLMVERKELFEYFVSLAIEAGVVFHFGCEILAPIMCGSRVCGIKTEIGDFYGDLIIDACGVYSPVRSQLPDYLRFDKAPAEYDVLHACRAYFPNIKDAPQPKTDYNVYMKVDGMTGLSWVVTEEDEVDILICRFHDANFNTVADVLSKMREENPHIGKEMLRGGKFVDIPIRQPMGMLVADGYAAIGDAAFMTYSIKGSGLAYSIQAGVMLADAVAADTECRFTAETLWEYEKTFFKEIGFGACRIAIVKSLLPYLTAQEVSDLFKEGFITSDELASLSSNAVETIIKSKIIPFIRKKARALDNVPELKEKLLDELGWQGKFTLIEPFFPNKYERDDVERWVDRYNDFFESIRFDDGIDDN